ncbi:general stress protein 69 [bacterium BMS3Abin07]|nr:general stress protein 69 [bacterium BMS3Abin07]GBE32389.1 general stress protein 69 [bacterium BMS3Bbin05]HDL20088.1 aldo/keto reductase [Nitrospirota bacterium]HDO22436.1 aldo/keto reductase [Nitrospirota bacterium]HDZ87478.1 aldo/keto reductase [Nitrospirota bacterium]
MKKEKILLPGNPVNAKTPWLWIGTWSMGGEGFGPHDERESLKVLESAVEKNIRHFDTADLYAHGRSEYLIRKIIQQNREEFFISTKGGLAWNGRRVEHRASPGELETQMHESLKRLKTDYIDLYQLHWPDPEIPVNESIGALKDLKKRGLIRYWGVGNLTAEQVGDYLDKEKNIPHQVHFNPVRNKKEILAAGSDRCINCVISPLEQGLLGTGKSSLGKEGIGKNDLRAGNPLFSGQGVLEWNRQLEVLAGKKGISKVSAVLLWICSRPHVSAVIPGPRRVSQLRDILKFRDEIDKNALTSSDKGSSILSAEKVKALMPQELWHHLDKAPIDA